ncbi:hypothetical protein [Streptomyces sp. JB150]|uniref:hypothetical protein n=1 Tax=Streptomyces sp. JB150 TaxID=2714844 RepID=UPI00140A90EB|nr:hypothetical protein [Streptomyces sp. JB150]QIJ64795.1 hypothetical protein G7Z13_24330 [Streptomyces sp. JB150]
MPADEGTHGTEVDTSRVRTGPRHAAPKKPLFTRFHMPAGKAIALAAMPTAVLMGMGFTPKLALAEDQQPASRSLTADEYKECVAALEDAGKGETATPTPSPSASAGASESPSDGGAEPSPSATSGSGSGSGDSGSGNSGAGDGNSADSGSADEPGPAPTASASAGAPATKEPQNAPTPSPTETQKGVLETIGDTVTGVVDGVVDGVTGGAEESASPVPSPSAPASPEPSTGAGPGGDSGSGAEDPAGDGAGQDTGGGQDTAEGAGDTASEAPGAVPEATESAGEATATPSPSASPSTDADDCPVATDAQGGVDNAVPLPDDPWFLDASSLTLKGADYKGIVEVRTANGTVKKVLKYVISDGTDIGDLHQTVKDDLTGRTYHVQAAKGSTSTIRDGETIMYTERISGNLLGLIPVTFDPEHPPPLNIPLIYFTKVKVQQAGQFGGTLHVPGLRQYVTD